MICPRDTVRTRPAIAVSSSGNAGEYWTAFFGRWRKTCWRADSSVWKRPLSTPPSWGRKRGRWRWSNAHRQREQAHGNRRLPWSSYRLWVTSASPHEQKLVETTLQHRFVADKPKRLIGDKGYDSDAVVDRLAQQHGIELIAPHRRYRTRRHRQDRRKLRRYNRRWKIERLFAWLKNFRRLLVRWERHSNNFLGMVQLACMLILLRRL